MAGDWIKMRGNLWDDPRVTSIADATGMMEATVIGALYWLWAAADQHSQDGIMPGLSLRAIDRKTGVPGFGDALVAIGWLDDHPEGVRLARFDEHNGASAKARVQTAKRVATHKGNAKVTQGALPETEDSVTTALPREEKRREEKSKGKVKSFTPAAPTFDARAELLLRGVEPQTADDWLALRKSKRAVVTATVLKSIIEQADKAGMALGRALETCCKRGWVGFEADWVLKDQRAGPDGAVSHLSKAGQATARNIEAWLGSTQNG